MNKYLDYFIDLCVIWDEEGKGKTHLRDEHPEIYNKLMELVDKETPMEVNMEDYHLEDECQYPIYSCPKCAKHITDGDSYCKHCGQRLLFIDIEESD